MSILRPLLALALVFTLAAATADGADGAKAKKKKKGGGQAGSVTAVSTDGITIKLGGKKKKGQPATEAKEEKIKINDSTVVEKVAGAKGERKTEAAKVGDIKTGERVVVQAENGVAKKITVLGGAKKKKKKNT